MSGSLNKVLLIGNLGKDPETFEFEGGGMIVRFSLATSETYKNREGQEVEQTEWHNVVVRRRGLAEVCARYLKKGQKIYLEGKLRTRQYTDKEGQVKYTTEVYMDEMTMLTPREDSSRGPAPVAQSGSPKPAASDPVQDGEDDLPF